MRVNMKAARITMNKSIGQVAKELGVCSNTVMNWERGHSEPTAAQFEDFLNYLGLTWEHVEPPRRVARK